MSANIQDHWYNISTSSALITDLALPVLADMFLRSVEDCAAESAMMYGVRLQKAKRAVNDLLREEDMNSGRVAFGTAVASMQLNIIR